MTPRKWGKAYKPAINRGDLQPLLDEVGTGYERDVFEWALTSGVEWFQQGMYPNPEMYADVTIASPYHPRGSRNPRAPRRDARLAVPFERGPSAEHLRAAGWGASQDLTKADLHESVGPTAIALKARRSRVKRALGGPLGLTRRGVHCILVCSLHGSRRNRRGLSSSERE